MLTIKLQNMQQSLTCSARADADPSFCKIIMKVSQYKLHWEYSHEINNTHPRDEDSNEIVGVKIYLMSSAFYLWDY